MKRKIKKRYDLFRKECVEFCNRITHLITHDEIVNKNEIRVLGLMRSGNHAFITWLFAQYDHPKYFLNYVAVNRNPFLFFHRKGTSIQFPQNFFTKPALKREALGLHTSKNALIYSFEDEFVQDVFSPCFSKNHERWIGKSSNKYNIFLLRDPFNLFASRMRKDEMVPCRYRLIDSQERKSVINIWKSYAKLFLENMNAPDGAANVYLNYNQWVVSQEYRQKILNILRVDHPNPQALNELPEIGGGSSFDKNEVPANQRKFFQRWKAYKDDDCFRSIFNDGELLELSDAIFGEIPGVHEWLIPTK